MADRDSVVQIVCGEMNVDEPQKIRQVRSRGQVGG